MGINLGLTAIELTGLLLVVVIGAAACAGLIVQKAVTEPGTFLYAGGLIGLGIVLWLVNRALTSGESRPG